METINDFCKWMRGQKRAAVALNLSESRVSRLCTGKAELTKDEAERAEAYSHGLFKKESLMWPNCGPAAQLKHD